VEEPSETAFSDDCSVQDVSQLKALVEKLRNNDLAGATP
jgi:hypothetical protein